MTLLEATDVVSGYGDVEIIHGVSLEVHEGEVVTVIGPNGAGKSTLMKTLFGLVDCWSGTITFDGVDLTGLEPNEMTDHNLSFVPQSDNVFPSLTIEENLRLGAPSDDEFTPERLKTVFEHFPVLEKRKEQKAGTLSGGQRQMLAMGRALMVDPDLLLLDEPSAGLSPDMVELVFEKVAAIGETGTSVLMIEQNAKRALEHSDRGYVLDMGENRIQAAADEILTDDEVVELYLGG
ncbi:ABC transporter ATP-binding protein [Haloferax sp. YSSS75]|uniref:ABC transporter ATP-binding protein n=1 Tax=Haloferax sp. YSSS75 TaxID=3388564 RepID=UPI00398D12E0